MLGEKSIGLIRVIKQKNIVFGGRNSACPRTHRACLNPSPAPTCVLYTLEQRPSLSWADQRKHIYRPRGQSSGLQRSLKGESKFLSAKLKGFNSMYLYILFHILYVSVVFVSLQVLDVCEHTFWGVCAYECSHICRPKVAMRNCPQLLLHFSHWGRTSQTNPELTSMMWLVLLTSLLLGVLCLHLPRLGVQAGHHTYLCSYGFLGQEFLSSYLQGKRHLLSHLPNPVSFFVSFQTTAPLFRCFGFYLGGGTFQNTLF